MPLGIELYGRAAEDLDTSLIPGPSAVGIGVPAGKDMAFPRKGSAVVIIPVAIDVFFKTGLAFICESAVAVIDDARCPIQPSY